MRTVFFTGHYGDTTGMIVPDSMPVAEIIEMALNMNRGATGKEIADALRQAGRLNEEAEGG